MKTWADYKEYVKGIDGQSRQEMEEIEIIAGIIGAMIDKRNELGYSQRDLAELCGMPQSSIARIESMKTTPNLDTLLKLMQPLGLKLTVSVA